VSCLPSIQAGGGTGLILIWQEKSGIPPKPPLPLFSCSNGTGTEAGQRDRKNKKKIKEE